MNAPSPKKDIGRHLVLPPVTCCGGIFVVTIAVLLASLAGTGFEGPRLPTDSVPVSWKGIRATPRNAVTATARAAFSKSSLFHERSGDDECSIGFVLLPDQKTCVASFPSPNAITHEMVDTTVDLCDSPYNRATHLWSDTVLRTSGSFAVKGRSFDTIEEWSEGAARYITETELSREWGSHGIALVGQSCEATLAAGEDELMRQGAEAANALFAMKTVPEVVGEGLRLGVSVPLFLDISASLTSHDRWIAYWDPQPSSCLDVEDFRGRSHALRVHRDRFERVCRFLGVAGATCQGALRLQEELGHAAATARDAPGSWEQELRADRAALSPTQAKNEFSHGFWTAFVTPLFEKEPWSVFSSRTYTRTASTLLSSTPVDVWATLIAAEFILSISRKTAAFGTDGQNSLRTPPPFSARTGTGVSYFSGDHMPGWRARRKRRPPPFFSAHRAKALRKTGDSRESCRDLLQDHMGPLLGRYFGAVVDLDSETLLDVNRLVDQIRLGAHAVINGTRFSSRGKAALHHHLAEMKVQVGRPQTFDGAAWFHEPHDWSRKNLVRNVARFRLREFQVATEKTRATHRLRDPDLLMQETEINAYYNKVGNYFALTYGILQKPFYDRTYSPASRFGALGSIIAHEIGHMFGPDGATFDAGGVAGKWWPEQDWREFKSGWNCLHAQFSYVTEHGVQTSGTRTFEENLADVLGVQFAFAGLEISLGRQAMMAEIEEFATVYAQMWATATTRDAEVYVTMNDVHSLARARVDFALANLPAFASMCKRTPMCTPWK